MGHRYNGGGSSATQQLTDLRNFCSCLIGRIGQLSTSPATTVRPPGRSGMLPGCLATRRSVRLLRDARARDSFPRQSCYVIALFLGYKVHLTRLINVGLSSVSLRGHRVHLFNGNRGRHVICLGSTYVRTLQLCLNGHGAVRKLLPRRGTIFVAQQHGRHVSGHEMRRLIANTVGTTKLGNFSARGLHRATTALVCRANGISVLALGRLLNRDGISAARVCARLRRFRIHTTVRRGPLNGIGGPGTSSHVLSAARGRAKRATRSSTLSRRLSSIPVGTFRNTTRSNVKLSTSILTVGPSTGTKGKGS